MHEPAVFTNRPGEFPWFFSYPEHFILMHHWKHPGLSVVSWRPVFSSVGKLMLFQIPPGKSQGAVWWEGYFCSTGANCSLKQGVAQAVSHPICAWVHAVRAASWEVELVGVEGLQLLRCWCRSREVFATCNPFKSSRVKCTRHTAAWPFVLISWADLKLSRAYFGTCLVLLLVSPL